jgi:hypothetical protein
MRCRSIRSKIRQSSQANRRSRRRKARLEIRGQRFPRRCESRASRERPMNYPAIYRTNCRCVGRKRHLRRKRRRTSEAQNAVPFEHAVGFAIQFPI